MLERTLKLPNLLKNKSYFLFGPRATGKSTLIKQQFPNNTLVIDLLKSDMHLRLTQRPQDLESIVMAAKQHDIVIIDEVQRIPMLLNEVHRLIEKHQIHFLLTGSSARKLRHGQANLLAGRARTAQLFPLTSQEIPAFNLERYLHVGGLPLVYQSDDPMDDLSAYVDTYLQEEIKAEALVRQFPAFTRFLHTASLTSGKMLRFTEVANDTGIPVSTVREYYYLLDDTFLGFMLPAWTKSQKRKALSTAKFYLFDLGVKHALAGIHQLAPATDLYGQAFEHFIALELRAYLSYRRLRLPLSYWQSVNRQEVDFIIGDDIAIEVKATENTQNKHLKGLKALAEENICQRYILVSRDPIKRQVDQYELWPWQEFLTALWQDELLNGHPHHRA